jgi:hypothetical protein
MMSFDTDFRMLPVSEKLVLGKSFQPSLIFAGKAGAYPSEAPFQVLHSRVGSSPNPRIFDCSGKACQGQTL